MSHRSSPRWSIGSPVTVKFTRVLLWCMAILCLARIATASDDYQWDFRVFYAAPVVLIDGGNPYDKETPNPEIPNHLSYLYPPVALYAFQPLSNLPFEVAYLFWFFIKVLALGLLLTLWNRHFECLNDSLLALALLILGFNAAILRDMTAGNIATLEQLGLWSAFCLLLRGRSYSAGAIIAFIAQFKLMPVVFLGLLPFVGSGRGWKPFWSSLIIFAGLFSLNFLLMPEMMAQYLDSFAVANPNLDERGEINPSTLALMRDVADLAGRLGVEVPPFFVNAVFLLYVSVLGAALLRFLFTRFESLSKIDQRWLIYAACLLYVLTMPRVKDYTYMILLIPALFIVRRTAAGPIVPLLAVALLLPATESYVPGLGSFFPWLQSYLPWFLACAMLWFMARWLAAALDEEPVYAPAYEAAK